MMFVILHQKYLQLLPQDWGKSQSQAAAAILNFLHNQREEGWLTINLPQFSEFLLGQWGRETIRKALESLTELGLIERKHHRMNGRAWQYRIPKKTTSTEVTVAPETTTVTPVEASVTPESATSISNIPTNIHHQYPSAVDEVFEEEKISEANETDFDSELESNIKLELEKIRCTPAIDPRPVLAEAKKNPENAFKAIAYTKHAIKTWPSNKTYNWTGVAIMAIRKGLVAPREIQQTEPQFIRKNEELDLTPSPINEEAKSLLQQAKAKLLAARGKGFGKS